MKLTWLYCNLCGVKDFSPLKGMPLTYIRFEATPVTDYSPLKDMPLEEFFGNDHLAANAPLLRAMKTLKRINLRPVADFWKEHDAKLPPKKP